MDIAGFFARPVVKAGAIGLGVLALVVGTLLVVNHIYRKGETAGGSKVTTEVQGETIRQTEKARQDKEKANESVRDQPIDAVIDGLR